METVKEENKGLLEPAPAPRGIRIGKFDDQYSIPFFYWYSHGRNYAALSRSEIGGEKKSTAWKHIGKAHLWREEAAYLDRQRYLRIRNSVEEATEERAKHLITIALQALDNALIFNHLGEIVDVGFTVESVADLDKISRLILLLQGDADQRVAVTSFSDLVKRVGGKNVGEGDKG